MDNDDQMSANEWAKIECLISGIFIDLEREMAESTYLYAVIAHRTVRTSGRSIEFARNTPFHSYGDSIYFGIFIQWRSEFIFTIFVGRC